REANPQEFNSALCTSAARAADLAGYRSPRLLQVLPDDGIHEWFHPLRMLGRPISPIGPQLLQPVGDFVIPARERVDQGSPARYQRLRDFAGWILAGLCRCRDIAVEVSPLLRRPGLQFGGPEGFPRLDLRAGFRAVVFVGPVFVALHFDDLDDPSEPPRIGRRLGFANGIDGAPDQH